MLRHLGQHGGGVLGYTNNLMRELLTLESPHEFVLMYPDRELMGSYGNRSNVKEVVARSRSKFVWDQIAVRQVEKKEKLDLVFNPKYSIPLTARCKTVFVCHGLDWYVMPWGSKWIDRISHRYLIPRYAHKADAIIAVSNTPRDHLIKFLNVDQQKIHTVYLGINEAFTREITAEEKNEVRNRYQLPKHFFLYVGQIYPPKNFGRLIRAYAMTGPRMGVSLVVAGTHTWLCGKDLALIEELGISDWVVQPGWIEHDTLPALYALADALLLPSLYEACPSPILEAMATNCPIVTSNRYGTQELAGDAAILVNPESVDEIAEGMRRVVEDQDLRKQITEKGKVRVKAFSWNKCARKTLQVLEGV